MPKLLTKLSYGDRMSLSQLKGWDEIPRWRTIELSSTEKGSRHVHLSTGFLHQRMKVEQFNSTDHLERSQPNSEAYKRAKRGLDWLKEAGVTFYHAPTKGEVLVGCDDPVASRAIMDTCWAVGKECRKAIRPERTEQILADKSFSPLE